nr:hypothetical protein 34 [Burkholderiaceae bacterium]
MNTLELTEQEFVELPWKESIRERIKEIIDCSDFKVLCALHEDNKLKAVGFEEKPEVFPKSVVGIHYLPEISLQNLSRTQKAVRLHLKKGYSVHKASKLAGVNHSAVFKALKRRQGKEICENCGQVIRKGFTRSQT